MTFTERHTWAGLAIGLITFFTYWIIVVARAATDGLPLVDVDWQGPMLVSLALGGGLYALVMLVLWLRGRGEALTDVRDHEIERHSASVGGGVTGIAVLSTLIMMTLDAPAFWTATVLFAGSFLASLASAAVTLAANRRGL